MNELRGQKWAEQGKTSFLSSERAEGAEETLEKGEEHECVCVCGVGGYGKVRGQAGHARAEGRSLLWPYHHIPPHFPC